MGWYVLRIYVHNYIHIGHRVSKSILQQCNSTSCSHATHTLSLSLSLSLSQVSATFAASLVISPSLGTWIDQLSHGHAQVILLATMITTFNLFFIIFMVPESLPERSRKASWGSPITWEQADPFAVECV